MTSTISRQEAGTETKNLAGMLTAPEPETVTNLVRPYVTGEHPIYRPATLDELTRLSANETLTLEAGLPPFEDLPYESRHAAPTVYPQPEEERPDGYRSRHRRPASREWLIPSTVAVALLVAWVAGWVSAVVASGAVR